MGMRIWLVLLAILAFSSCESEKDGYVFAYFVGGSQDGLHLAYSYDGLRWETINNGKSVLKPTVGKDKLMRDPCIILGVDGRYHMVWTTGWNDKGIGYAHSEDLITWSQQQIIPVMEHEDSARNSWAPELFYDSELNIYHIFWATTIPNRHRPILGMERESNLNHRIYATSTQDFENFEPTRLFYNPDFSVIDATIMPYEDEFIMFVKNENPYPPEKNICMVKSPHAAGPWAEVSAPITGDYWAEGPTPFQVGEYTYVFFDRYRDHYYGAIRSVDLEVWEDVTDSISFPRGLRHGTVFKAPKSVIDQLCLIGKR